MAVDRLEAYRGERDFASTPEPAPGGPEGPAACRFVVQEHHARRLHWDFRLERDGVLVSWALPRGFPDEPGEDLPAARTGDHPLDYIGFEGTIPAGSYGAGEVTVWDSGVYACDAFEEDKVVVELHGDRLRGRYALYRTREDWRIHRMHPPEPGDQRMPDRVVPMLAQPGRSAARPRALRIRGQVGRDPRPRVLAAGPAAPRDAQPGRCHRSLAGAARPRPAARRAPGGARRGDRQLRRRRPPELRAPAIADASDRRSGDPPARAGDPRRLRGLRSSVARRRVAHAPAI